MPPELKINYLPADLLVMKLQRLFHVILWCIILSHALLPPPSPLDPPSIPPAQEPLNRPFHVPPRAIPQVNVMPDMVISRLNGWEVRYLYFAYMVQLDDVVGYRTLQPRNTILRKSRRYKNWSDFLKKISPGQPDQIYRASEHEFLNKI